MRMIKDRFVWQKHIITARWVLRELGLGNMGFEMRMRTKVKRLFEIANVWVVRKKYGIRFPTL